MDIQFNEILIDSLQKAQNRLNNVIGYRLEINISTIIEARTIIEGLIDLAKKANGENYGVNPENK